MVRLADPIRPEGSSMTPHMLDPAITARFIPPGGQTEYRTQVRALSEMFGRWVVEVVEGKGYFYLPMPYDRTPDGAVNLVWVADPSVSWSWEVERPSYPRLSAT
jgi:hypothetical protein